MTLKNLSAQGKQQGGGAGGYKHFVKLGVAALNLGYALGIRFGQSFGAAQLMVCCHNAPLPVFIAVLNRIPQALQLKVKPDTAHIPRIIHRHGTHSEPPITLS
jgi:hypothetical protein